MYSYLCPNCCEITHYTGIPRCARCGNSETTSASDRRHFVSSCRRLANDQTPPKRSKSVHVLDDSKSEARQNVQLNISNLKRNQIGENQSKNSDSVASTSESVGLAYGNLATPGPSGYQRHLNTTMASSQQMHSLPQSELQSVECNEQQISTRQIHKKKIAEQENNEQDNCTRYRCCACNYKQEQFTLQEHIQHHYPAHERCRICRERTVEFPGHESEHTCKVCGEKFPCKTLLGTHLIDHKETCILCGNKISEHKKHPGDEKPYQCCKCSRRIHHKYNFLRHNYSHLDSRPYRCRVCDYRTNWSQSLHAHAIYHKTCEICNLTNVYNVTIRTFN